MRLNILMMGGTVVEDDDYIAYIERTIKSYSDDELESIGAYAFGYCSKLTSISLPACTNVGSNAFNNCSSLTTVDLSACTSVDNFAFGYCSKLTSISLPTCTSVGNNAFYGCSKLTSIHFSAANQATIEALDDYSSKFGASNATIYFDL